MTESLIRRNLATSLTEDFATFRASMLTGARQTGKTTLLRALGDLEVVSLDDPSQLSSAISDPVGFVAGLARPAGIDEFQRAGEPMLLAIKEILDRDNARGQFILSGSTNYLAQRGVSETLAGRVSRTALWPLSMGERAGVSETFLDHLFSPATWPPHLETHWARDDVVGFFSEGGYPEVVTQGLTGRSRRQWFSTYLDDVISREALHPVAEVRLERELRTVFRLLAARAGSELVLADLARDSGLNRHTVTNYVALLQALFLVTLVPAWATSATTRAKRSPKVLICDTGLAMDAAGVGVTAHGAMFENWVVGELHKQLGWTMRSLDLLHFRDRNGAEIDCLVEDRRTGETAGIEVKLTSTPRPDDARHLRAMAQKIGPSFRMGVLIHTGTQCIQWGPELWAVPAAAIIRSDRAA